MLGAPAEVLGATDELREIDVGEAKRRKASGSYPDTSQPKVRPPKPEIETLSWEVLGDLTQHPKSQDVLQALQALKEEWTDHGGNLMVVTLESAPQVPLIKIQVTGLGAFMGVIGALQDLDLVDRLEEAAGPEKGVDAAFS
jgi:hypothetical protein